MLGVIKQLIELIGLVGQTEEAAPRVARLRSSARTALLWLVITELLEIIQLYPIKYFIDGIANQRSMSYLVSVVGVMFGVDIMVRIISNVMNRTRHRTDWQLYTLLLGFGHTKQLTMDVAWHVKHGTNEKESIIAKNLEKIDNLTSAVIYQGLPLVVRVALTVVVLLVLDPLFALLAVMAVAGYAGVMAFNRRHVLPLNESFHHDWKDMHTRGTELSTKARALKQFGVEAEVADKYRDVIEGYYQADSIRNREWRRFQRRAEYVLMAAFPLMYLLLALRFGQGGNVGSAVLLSTWLQRIFVNLYQFRDVQRHISEGTEALGDYVALFSTTPLIRQPETPVVPKRLGGGIELRGVSFAYPGNCHPMLKDLNVRVEPGATVALVGPSGAGKTTVVSLLSREVDPTNGTVLFDGVDLREFDYDFLRQQMVGVVSQDVQLMDATIADNIRIGDNLATDEMVRAAARAAHADEFIADLPAGYHTHVGENGVRLSGGQRQRIAIARALLRDPKILILDEATSALDAESQHYVQQTVDERIAARTSTNIVIAHRLSTVRSADLVFYMEDGRIVESGSHDELMELGKRYATMVARELGTHLD